MRHGTQLARMMAIGTGALWLFAATWLFWRWEASPVQAILGAVLTLGGAPIVFAIQLLLLTRVARADLAPRATAGELLRAWWNESRLLYPIFHWRLPYRSQAIPDQPALARRSGVVLVHGFLCNRGFWLPWMRELQARGIPFVAVSLEPVFGSIDDYVPAIEEAAATLVRATGHAPTLVCHSMGGLAARAWLRSPGHSPVKRLVTVGTPHHGTWLARFSRVRNGRQMRLHSAWLRELEKAGLPRELPVICWYSNCDNIVMPPMTATLEGADNRLLRGAAHVDLAFHPDLTNATYAMLEQDAAFFK